MAIKLLVIDDEKDCAELTRCILEFGGFAVESFTDSLEGLARVKKERYDAVLIDLMMPKMDGLEWIKELRSLPAYAQTPVFVLSSKTLSDAERKFLLTAQTHFIAKPFQPLQLTQMLREKLLH